MVAFGWLEEIECPRNNFRMDFCHVSRTVLELISVLSNLEKVTKSYLYV